MGSISNDDSGHLLNSQQAVLVFANRSGGQAFWKPPLNPSGGRLLSGWVRFGQHDYKSRASHRRLGRGRPSLFTSPDFLARQPPPSPAGTRKTRVCPPRSSPQRPLHASVAPPLIPARLAGPSLSRPRNRRVGGVTLLRGLLAASLGPACHQNARGKRGEGVSDVRARSWCGLAGLCSGSVAALKGSKGKDCEVNVPPGISVVTDDGKLFGELYKEGDRLLVAHGGLGGCPVSNFRPSKGQKHLIHLDLKLIADVGLVGFPNAGKSSLLSKISRATPQIADYAFTTVQPELGTIQYPDYKKITVADLPGLIEGAHENKGHGHKFLKHMERTQQLLFVVDVSGFQLSSRTPFRTAFETVVLLARELELYKEELRAKPALLAVNKMDLPNAQELLDELMEQLQRPEDYMRSLSAKMIPDVLVKFKEIIPISAHTGEGLDKLVPCIRKVIDEEDEKETENYHKQQLHKLHSEIR